VTASRGTRRVLVVGGAVVVLGLVALVVLGALLRFSPLWGAMGMFDDARRAEAFRTMATTFPAHRVAAGDEAWPFTVDERALPEHYVVAGEERSVSAFLEATETTGLLVARDGVIVHEAYHRGYDASARIASFSVAKPIVTALVGIAVERGLIASIDDPLERYVPELERGGYAGVTIRQALTMTSGVAWNEAYDDPRSDVMGLPIQVYGLRRSVPSLLARLDRDRAPGLERAYASSDALALGTVVARVARVPLATFLAEALWVPAGMEAEAAWNTDLHGNALSHAFLSATLRDYARFGRLVLHGGARDGRQVVPAAWIDDALRVADAPRAAPEPQPFGADFDLAYHWWRPDASEDDAVAIGIYGQYLYVHRGLGVVIVKTSTDAGFAGREPETVAVLRTIARSLAAD
jgi:CubicO group peptidase (beta-lactamase class C family)